MKTVCCGILLKCIVLHLPETGRWFRLWIPRSPMPPVEAASGWSVVPVARNAASAYFPSISSMLSGSVKDLRIWQTSAPERADRVRQRAREAVSRLSKEFPGDPATGLLDEGDEAEQRFAEFANEEPCPALDPETGLCELYEARPMTCRVFGPPVRSEDGLGVCELCFQGATDAEIAACEMNPDPDDLESALIDGTRKSYGRARSARLWHSV